MCTLASPESKRTMKRINKIRSMCGLFLLCTHPLVLFLSLKHPKDLLYTFTSVTKKQALYYIAQTSEEEHRMSVHKECPCAT